MLYNLSSKSSYSYPHGNTHMTYICKIVFLAIFMLFLKVPNVSANPDVWVKAGLTYRFADGKLTGLKFNWRFDEYFSSRAMQTYDCNQSGVLETAEAERLRVEIFDPLSKFDYYVHLWVAGEKQTILSIENFAATIDGAQLVYQFTVALQTPIDPSVGVIITSLYDQKIVVDFRFFTEDFLLVEGVLDPSCKFSIARGKGAQSGHPQPITLNCGA